MTSYLPILLGLMAALFATIFFLFIALLQRRRLVILAVMLLVLFAASLGGVLLTPMLTESRADVLISPDQVAVLPSVPPEPSETATPISLSATSVLITTPSSTNLVQPTVISATPAPTLPESSLTHVPSPTSEPVPTLTAVTMATVESSPTTLLTPTLPSPMTTTVAPDVPTLVPLTETPSVNISRVNVPRAYIYDRPSTNNSIIGGVDSGDELVILGASGTWYLVRINEPGDGRTRIEGGQGWIERDQVTAPRQQVPMITP